MQRCFSTLTVTKADEGRRELVGIASTPTPDLVDDVIAPRGARFKLPLPLLLLHDHAAPIGHVVAATVTDAGIEVRARIATVAERGALQQRLDSAWQSVRAGLLRGLSIGFRPIESERRAGGRGMLVKAWQWLELSVVTIPCNSEAGITEVKAAFAARGAGANYPGRRPGVVYLDRPHEGVVYL